MSEKRDTKNDHHNNRINGIADNVWVTICPLYNPILLGCFICLFFSPGSTRLEGNNNGDCISRPFFSIFSDSHKVHINIFTLDFNAFFSRSVILIQMFHWIVAMLFSKGLPLFSWPLSNDNSEHTIRRNTLWWGVGMH